MRLLSTIVIVLMTLAASASADVPDDCLHHADPELRLKSCSAAAEAGRWQGRDLARIYFNRGITHGRLGSYDKARADFDRALDLDPDYALAYRERAVAYVALRRYELALRDADRALDLMPGSALAYHKRGVIRGLLGEHELAIADFDEALLRAPGNAEIYYNRGVSHDRLKAFAQAVADYDQVLRYDPASARAYKNRGTAYCNLGNVAAAVADWDDSIALRGQAETRRFQVFLMGKGLYVGPASGLLDAPTRAARLAYAQSGCR